MVGGCRQTGRKCHYFRRSFDPLQEGDCFYLAAGHWGSGWFVCWCVCSACGGPARLVLPRLSRHRMCGSAFGHNTHTADTARRQANGGRARVLCGCAHAVALCAPLLTPTLLFRAAPRSPWRTGRRPWRSTRRGRRGTARCVRLLHLTTNTQLYYVPDQDTRVSCLSSGPALPAAHPPHSPHVRAPTCCP